MHRESWGIVNYGNRGPRGRAGRGVYSLTVDSEGILWAEYTDRSKQEIGPIPEGQPGEPGKDGRIQDVIVNGQTVVDSEGVAYITTSEGAVYTAGDHIEISPDNVISADIDDIIGEELLVNIDCGGYYAGDVISADTTLRDIIKHLLNKETPPVPPVTDTWFFGVANTTDPTTVNEIPSSASSKPIDTQEAMREGMVQYFTTKRQCAYIAYPAVMGNLVSIFQNDLPFNLVNNWRRVDVVNEGVPYIMYVNGGTQGTDSKYNFNWR